MEQGRQLENDVVFVQTSLYIWAHADCRTSHLEWRHYMDNAAYSGLSRLPFMTKLALTTLHVCAYVTSERLSFLVE